MKNSILTCGLATALAILLSACGGGGGGGGGTLPGAGGGTITGNIASIAGDYTVTVSLAECDPLDSDATTSIVAVSPGVCRISSTTAQGSVVETRKDLLTPGTYRLTLSSNGNVSIGAITRSCAGTCIVSGSVYTIADAVQAGGGANISLTQIIFDTTANPKRATGLIYGSGLQVTGANLASGESGVIVFE